MSHQPTQPNPGQFPVVIMVPQNYGQRFLWSSQSQSQPPGLSSHNQSLLFTRLGVKGPGPFTAVMDLVTSYLQTLIKDTATVLVIELIIISVILSRPLGLIIHTVMGGQHSTQHQAGEHF